MNYLLQTAVKAHGGLERWKQLRSVRAELSIGGALWPLKGKQNMLKDVRIEGLLHEQRLVTHLHGEGKRLVYSPNRVSIETEDGVVNESRHSPRDLFAGHSATTPWSDLHVAYFSSYALWTYLTIPFLYAYSGFVVEELPAWEENGEIWRPLKATFPAEIATHTTHQTSYFGPDGLLRRHEYTVDVLGGASGLNYADRYRDADGIVVPTLRTVFASDSNKQKIAEPVLVTIDIGQISFA